MDNYLEYIESLENALRSLLDAVDYDDVMEVGGTSLERAVKQGQNLLCISDLSQSELHSKKLGLLEAWNKSVASY